MATGVPASPWAMPRDNGRALCIRSVFGRELLDKILSTPAGSSNGRTADSGSAYLGSNPSPAGVDRSGGSSPSAHSP